jgi:hypothetical protein
MGALKEIAADILVRKLSFMSNPKLKTRLEVAWQSIMSAAAPAVS